MTTEPCALAFNHKQWTHTAGVGIKQYFNTVDCMPRFTKLKWLICMVIGIVKSVDIRDAQPNGWVSHSHANIWQGLP